MNAFKNYRRCALAFIAEDSDSLASTLSLVGDFEKQNLFNDVSRWQNNLSADEPALELYIKERLISQLSRTTERRLAKPINIAVGGGKGGSGGSLVANALAIVASRLGYRVALCEMNRNCFDQLLNRRPIDCAVQTFSSNESLEECHFDFIFTDVQSMTFSHSLTLKDDLAKIFKSYDFVLIPTNLASPDASVALDIFSHINDIALFPKWAAVHVASKIYPKIFVHYGDQLKKWIPKLCSVAIITDGMWHLNSGDFTNDHIARTYHTLLEDVCNQLNFYLPDYAVTSDDLRKLTLPELVNYARDILNKKSTA